MLSDIKFPWEYTDEELRVLPKVIGQHGRLVDYRWDAYNDIYVYEDGHEERVYIGD